MVCGQNSKKIDVIPFSFGGVPSSEFPAKLIEQKYSFDTEVWDVCQSKHLTFAEERRLESEPDAFVLVENNRRPGRANVQIQVSYTPPASNSVSSYVGEVTVEISALEPEVFPDAFAATIEVFETIVGKDEQKTETLVESITINMAPSYLIVEKAFFEDRWRAIETLLRTVRELDRKILNYLRSDPYCRKILLGDRVLLYKDISIGSNL
ncbi:hypothetical protein [Nitrosomonas sp. Nm34]|uniref:hypothetical protein n=1 Tax=Nitrosomonas sp. Nm34 TaxID=1881055 RepID=UPI0008E60757|nr:hypothetical protein [Nitrosomonas sp. Nm34]SFI90277.1 hypothetical protein SAMN05428978_105514 [Nitrosomonas sp. Nm34]